MSLASALSSTFSNSGLFHLIPLVFIYMLLRAPSFHVCAAPANDVAAGQWVSRVYQRILRATPADDYTKLMECPDPLPLPPYPGAPIYMQGYFDTITHMTRFLLYHDPDLGTEYILGRTDLCSRAACKCTQWGVVCNNFDYVYFVKEINFWYRPLCLSTCRCKHDPKAVASAPSMNMVNSSVEAVQAMLSNGTAVAAATCLAGRDTGWTTKQYANCCPGYAFQALDPQTAYHWYGLRENMTVLQESATEIGICSSNMSTADVSTS